MSAQHLIFVFDEIFMKDDLEKAILAVHTIRQLLADEPTHSDEVEAELAKIVSAIDEIARLLTRARIRFDQLSPQTKPVMRTLNLHFRRILIGLALALDGDKER